MLYWFAGYFFTQIINTYSLTISTACWGRQWFVTLSSMVLQLSKTCIQLVSQTPFLHHNTTQLMTSHLTTPHVQYQITPWSTLTIHNDYSDRLFTWTTTITGKSFILLYTEFLARLGVQNSTPHDTAN